MFLRPAPLHLSNSEGQQARSAPSEGCARVSLPIRGQTSPLAPFKTLLQRFLSSRSGALSHFIISLPNALKEGQPLCIHRKF